MEVDRKLLAPCGLYCGVCAIRIAHRDGNQKFKESLSNVYGIPVADLHCEGCLSDDVIGFCKICAIKSCTTERGYEGCHECDEFPCKHVEEFAFPVGKRVMLRAIPEWRELGTEAWVAAEIERYTCECGQALFRGAKRCRACGRNVDVD